MQNSHYLKAQLIVKELTVLDDEHIAAAERMILDELAGKTPAQLARLAALAVDTVDLEGARRRREHAEREDARVRLWRESTGASAMAAHGLPADAALAANANISQRAEEYKKTRIYPDARMDQLRVLAFSDILNGITAAARIARAQDAARIARAQDQANARAQDQDHAGPGAGTPADTPAGREDGQPDSSVPGSQEDRPCNEAGPGDDSPGPGDGPGTGDAGPVLPARSNLTLPLATLLGLAERPGEAHGLGPLDPALVRDLAAAAARSLDSDWCLTLPDGRQLTVRLGPIPVTDCDHRHESHGYQPGGTLRHLVQIRDGTCTFPSCSRHARGCDFEHAVPYDQGGRTCACNAGARSRRCHKVKQSKGWTVTQPRPGWHQWTTPSGRTYTNGPMKYPA